MNTTPTHGQDSDCSLDGDFMCTVCRVYHGDPCGDCGGRGFHTATCSDGRGYRVRLLNHDRSVGDLFDTFKAAVEAGKRIGFEFAVQVEGGGVVAGWSPISGLRMVAS